MSSSDFQAGGAQPMQRATLVRDAQAPTFVSKANDAYPEPQVTGKWSGRKTLLFIVVTCGVAWIAIIAGVMAVL